MTLDSHSSARRRAAVACAACVAAPWLAARATAADALRGDSVYQLSAALTDQDGKPFELASLRGGPVLVSMFYTSCEMVCPMLFETIHHTLQALPEAQRASVRVLMVSFDPARDTVPVLKATARARGCDARWTLARCDADTARRIAAVLHIQYRRLDSGEFNHSTVIDLLDKEGRIAASTGKLGQVDRDFVKAVSQPIRSRA
jgi:protein SCO1/2